MRGTGGDRSNDMLRLLCWNIARRHAAWRCLLDSGMDVALLQEAGTPPGDVAERVEVDPEPFRDGEGGAISRTAIVRLSDRVRCRLAEAHAYRPKRSRAISSSASLAAFRPQSSPHPASSRSRWPPSARHTRNPTGPRAGCPGILRRLSASRHSRPVAADRKTEGTPHHSRRRPYRPVRLWRKRLLEAALRLRVRPYGGDRSSSGRPTVSQWSSGRALAQRATEGQSECPYQSSPAADTRNGDASIGLRIRLRESGGLGQRTSA